ncbi:MAG: tetratricopeptide repeat protein, partial [Anaerolineales bacterium]
MTEVTLSAYQDQIDYMVEEARYLEAFAHLRHILKQYPRYVDAYYLLGKMMLEAALPNLAIDMFRRVLNAQPEHLLARIGLGLAHEHLGNSKAALWNLERAFELDPGNEELAGELRRLYAQQGGVMPDHLSLTRAGLARLYLRGDLYGRAAEEFQAMLEKEPLRVDLRVALAEAYWRDDQIVQAADVCQQTLTDFPYSLKANLLLGTLWLKSGQEEGERYLQRAREIDPQNDLATQLFGSASLMEPKAVNIERLSYDPQAISVDREEEWFKHLEAASVSTSVSEALPDMTETEMRLVDITAGLESQIEIPDWLRDLGPLDEDEEVPAWFQEEDLETEEVSSWLKETGVEEAEGAEALPSWFEDVEAEGLEEEAVPDWFRDLAPEEAEIDIEAAFAEETAPEGELVEGELPEWLQGAQPPAGRLATEEIEEELEEEGVPEWLQELRPPEMEAEEETL